MIKVFFGKDAGLVTRTALKEVSKIKEVIKYDGYKDPVSDLLNECVSLSLFGDKKTIFFRNAYFLSSTKPSKPPIKDKDQDYKGLLNYFNSPEQDTDLYIAVPGNLDSKSELVKSLKSLPADFEEVHELKEEEYISLAMRFAKKEGGDIDRDGAKLLTEYCQGDYLLFINNLTKLLIYNKHVREDDVKLLVTKPLEDKAYDLASKLLTRKIASALKSYQELRANGWDALALLMTLSSQFRFMALVKYLIRENYTNDDIAQNLSTKTNKVKGAKIYYTRKDLQNTSYTSLINILTDLADIEKDVKLNNDSADDRLELFFLSFR